MILKQTDVDILPKRPDCMVRMIAAQSPTFHTTYILKDPQFTAGLDREDWRDPCAGMA